MFVVLIQLNNTKSPPSCILPTPSPSPSPSPTLSLPLPLLLPLPLPLPLHLPLSLPLGSSPLPLPLGSSCLPRAPSPWAVSFSPGLSKQAVSCGPQAGSGTGPPQHTRLVCAPHTSPPRGPRLEALLTWLSENWNISMASSTRPSS